MDYTKPRDVTVTWRTERETDDGRRYAVQHAYDRTLEAPLKRFMAKVNTDGPGGCWLWEGYVDPAGYGRWRMPDQKNASSAHRASYIMLKGPIPKGKYLDHLCRVRSCVNPDHLEPVTPYENVDRGLGRKRDACRKGHDLTGPNGGKRADGRRYCKQCSIDRAAKSTQTLLAKHGQR